MCLSVGLTGLMAKYIFQYDWTWEQCMLFGSIISATDPVAIVSLLSDLGTSKQLGVLIEGESLFNDGSAIVLYTIFKKLSFDSMTATEIGTYFPKVACGGIALGYIGGKLTVFWLQNVFNDAMVEITITLSSTYVIFYLGEYVFEVSGVLAVVMLGIKLNQHQSSISPELQVFLHRFWEILAYLANTLIFLLVGVAIMEKAFDIIEKVDWFYIIFDYIGLFAIRSIVITFFRPILKRLGYGFPLKDSLVVIWGGLRGAVGLALALMVAMEHTKIGQQMLLHTAGIVVLTLLINATTLLSLLKHLGISKVSEFKKGAMKNAVRRLNLSKLDSWMILKTDRFLADADWSLAEKACEIDNPYAENDAEDTFADRTQLGYTLNELGDIVLNKPSEKEFARMMEDGRRAVLKGHKMSFWRQFERGVLSSEAVNILVSLTESCHDNKDRLIELNDISPHWKVPVYWKVLRKRLIRFKQINPKERVTPPRNLFLRFCFFIASHIAFDITMNILITLNMIPITFALFVDDKVWYAKYFNYLNYAYCIIYIIEAFLKMFAFRKHYFLDPWNWSDLVIVLLSIIDVAIDLASIKNSDGETSASAKFSPSILKIMKIFRILRMGRVVKLIKGLIPKLIDYVNNRINKKISFGYDIGKGFVVAGEEVVKIIDQLVLDPNIAADLKMRLDCSRLEVVRSLGLLQMQHPGVAISVKTRQAIRNVLNNVRDALNELRANGALETEEALKLNRIIEVKMKRQLQAPSYIAPRKPENILKSLVWLRDLEEDGIAYITSNIEIQSFEYGDVILKQGESSDGIFVIISGMVKLVGVSAGIVDFQQKPLSSTLNISSDYLYAGNVIGEMGLLTSSVRNASVISETIVQMLEIILVQPIIR